MVCTKYSKVVGSQGMNEGLILLSIKFALVFDVPMQSAFFLAF